VQHSDPDVLALVALGESAPAGDAAHIAGCPQCRDEVAALGQVVATVRSDAVLDAALEAGTTAAVAAEGGPAVTPPPHVWDAIASRTGVAVAPRPEVVAAAAPPAAAPPDVVVPLLRARGPARRSDVPSRGRWSRARTLTLAVAASLLVGAAAGSLATHALSNPATAPAQQQVLAQVDLDNLKPQNTSASGHATVVETAAGPRLKVDVAALRPQAGHFYEVWLIDKNIKKMVPVGILAPGDDEFVIPDGVDISQYPVVDISVQQPGDPRHSGDSVLRGTITG
jgi:Anti-sigma-K factor rskA